MADRHLSITVIGLGYVGIVAAAGLASAGHRVLGVDNDPARFLPLQQGRVPLHEPGLPQLVRAGVERGNLRFAHPDFVHENLGDVAIITTGTPSSHSGAVDLRQVRSAVSWIKSKSPGRLVLVMKSTVPPGTGRKIAEDELSDTTISYVSIPEFLREGLAIQDWAFPARVVIGSLQGDRYSLEIIRAMHTGITAPIIFTDITSAEMIKYASNAFLATRISFMNEIASICDTVGASVDAVSEGMAMDPRTGTRISAGVGYGGSCFPKDVRALDHLALNGGVSVDLLRSVIDVNNRQRLLPLYALRRRFNGTVSGVRVAILGLAFKPNTDDVREAPSLDLIKALVDDGAEIRAYDPQANESARMHLPAGVRLADTPVEAADQAEAMVLLTDWEQIVHADWSSIAQRMKQPRFVFDGRNMLDPARAADLGFHYIGVGRNNVGLGNRDQMRNGSTSEEWSFHAVNLESPPPVEAAFVDVS